jgi:uncharacterized cupin superfamily protein
MAKIKIKSGLTEQELDDMGVFNWSIWSHEAADFPWMYAEEETCYFLEGKVTVIPEGGEAVEMGAGDLVTFPKGMECRWIIHEAVRKHYIFKG